MAYCILFGQPSWRAQIVELDHPERNMIQQFNLGDILNTYQDGREILSGSRIFYTLVV